MSNGTVVLSEVGPREGFQFEGIGRPVGIPVDDKLKLIAALTTTGVRSIEAASFVSPKVMPQMADAAELAKRLPDRPDVSYRAMYLSAAGLQRAIDTGRFAVDGRVMFTASETFSRRNQHRTHEEDVVAQRRCAEAYAQQNIPVDTGAIAAAFGCNYEGDIATSRLLQLVDEIADLCAESGSSLRRLNLADTMGWATPPLIRTTVRAIQDRYPQLHLSLHLHDTRGAGIANLVAGIDSGVLDFDTSVGGLGGCPFAGVAAGNVSTEDAVFLCERMGYETGIDLQRMIDCAALAERIVGHSLPSRMLAVRLNHSV